MNAWISLGSNLGDRKQNISSALARMEDRGIRIIKLSSLYETAPYGKTDQPPFINCACMVETSLCPADLLLRLLSIEKELGRVRKEHWGPRIIDLDILFYEDKIIDERNLAVPHPDMQNRLFVLEPLAEISPDLVHPVLGKSIAELLEGLTSGIDDEREALRSTELTGGVGGEREALRSEEMSDGLGDEREASRSTELTEGVGDEHEALRSTELTGGVDSECYREALSWIENRARFGMKLGLNNIRALLAKLGNPERSVHCLHIAGTNGKGSVAAYLSSVLEEAGYKTGLFTSPFIETFRERFRINRENISEAQLLRYITRVRPVVEEMDRDGMISTHFEILTAIGFVYFAEENVDFAVIEVGLGGLYDSTNVIDNPVAALITAIDYDHTEYLGDTLPDIATQKAGIIKTGKPVFVYPNSDEVMETVKSIANEKNAPCSSYNKGDVRNIKTDRRGTEFDFRGTRYFVVMSGEYQAYNAALAIFALRKLRECGIVDFSEKELLDGLSKAKLIARMEILHERPQILLDGSHNIQGITALVKALPNYKYNRLILGIGILKDKRHREMLNCIVPHADVVIATEIPMDRTLPAETLAEEISLLGAKPVVEKAIDKALVKSVTLAEPDDMVLWCGSLYLAGEIRKCAMRLFQDGACTS